MEDRLLNSIERTAQRLDISIWTVRAWISQGKLESVKLGSRRLVPEESILKLLEGAKAV